ncbi:hypothetical protein EVAR_59288_1 [Eumeta japonica]|uniref:Uncharacterized protein n=1 Tax=Eumeta variegata TaxID=151549 RepID=A0A4C1YDQ1_EUMVA|nr:hypothetical protein EVAR_59288_1 [Eumeta japonica]
MHRRALFTCARRSDSRAAGDIYYSSTKTREWNLSDASPCVIPNVSDKINPAEKDKRQKTSGSHVRGCASPDYGAGTRRSSATNTWLCMIDDGRYISLTATCCESLRLPPLFLPLRIPQLSDPPHLPPSLCPLGPLNCCLI